ncbi:MAG: hypothetical protein JOZ77_12720 [Candidatus Eremiobacteraeota bacterium]|nr:hypothetical protein [Candidatus Eremiobacteraeota bacterium]
MPLVAASKHRVNRATSYQLIYSFRPQKNGIYPEAGLLDVNGTLYGTTASGGLSGKGTVYGIGTSGVPKVLYRFRGGSDGSEPQSALLNVNGTLYGTTAYGGSSNAGTIYSISTSGTESVVYSFKGGADGANPVAGLVDVNGTLYGTTSAGGGSGCYGGAGCGTVFSVGASGQESVLHRFTGGADGAVPVAELIDVNGVLYGTTAQGGKCGGKSGDCGTVYTITPAGTEKVLYAFRGGTDGEAPTAGLIDMNGTLYGTTYQGGQSGSDCGGSCGTVYQISPAGAEKVIYRFADGTDGAAPQAELIAVNGVLYGTTTGGGDVGSCFQFHGNCGTVFSVTTAGVETVLYRFVGGTDGWSPLAPLTNLNGTLYGTTVHGGVRDVCCHTYGYGTIFSVSP